MEIHPPEKPIHTVKDFLLQLMPVTIGILIALSLEGALEWSHHRTLVSEAQENLRHEMLDNKKEIETALHSYPNLKKNEESAMRFIGDLQARRAKGRHELNYSYYLALPSSTSWGTAQAAGALAYMPYDDVQRYASIYDKQRKFDTLQDRLRESVVAAMPSDDVHNSTEQELRDWDRRLQVSMAYLSQVEGVASSLRDEYDKALR